MWVEPEGEATAKVVIPSGLIHPVTIVIDCAVECWLKIAAMFDPCRESVCTEANTEGNNPSTVEEWVEFCSQIKGEKHAEKKVTPAHWDHKQG